MNTFLTRTMCVSALGFAVLCSSVRGIANPPVIEEAPCPASPGEGIAAGPDSTIWFAVTGKIVCMNDKGRYHSFDLPPGGPLGNHGIWRMSTKIEVKVFKLPDAEPFRLTPDKNGNVWFSDMNRRKNRIGRITSEGDVSYYSAPTPEGSPYGITTDKDDNIWFTEPHGNKIGKVNLSHLNSGESIGGGNNRAAP